MGELALVGPHHRRAASDDVRLGGDEAVDVLDGHLNLAAQRMLVAACVLGADAVVEDAQDHVLASGMALGIDHLLDAVLNALRGIGPRRRHHRAGHRLGQLLVALVVGDVDGVGGLAVEVGIAVALQAVRLGAVDVVGVRTLETNRLLLARPNAAGIQLVIGAAAALDGNGAASREGETPDRHAASGGDVEARRAVELGDAVGLGPLVDDGHDADESAGALTYVDDGRHEAGISHIHRRVQRRRRDEHLDALRAERDVHLIAQRVSRYRVGAGLGLDVLDPGVGHRVDNAEDRVGLAIRGAVRGHGAGGHEVALLAGQVPHLVSAADLGDGLDDVAAGRVHDLRHGLARQFDAIAAAAQQELVLAGVDCEPVRHAVRRRERGNHFHRLGIDAVDLATLVLVRLRDGDVEEAVALVVYRLLDAVRRVGVLDLPQHVVVRRVDKGDEGRIVRIIGDEDDLVLGIVGQLVGALLAASRHDGRDLAGVEIDDLQRAVAVTYPGDVALVVGDDAIRTGRVIVARPTDEAPYRRVEGVVVVGVVDDVQAAIGAVGQVVHAVVVDPADVEAERRGTLGCGDVRRLHRADVLHLVDGIRVVGIGIGNLIVLEAGIAHVGPGESRGLGAYRGGVPQEGGHSRGSRQGYPQWPSQPLVESREHSYLLCKR